MDDRNAPPLNPLPLVVWVLALPMIAMEVVLNMASAGLVGGAEGIGWRLQAIERFAFVPDLMRRMVELGVYPPEALVRLISYPLVHSSTTHALMAVVILLALGKMVGEVFRWWAVLVVFLGATAAGALVYTFVLPSERTALIGAYPGDYGLIGAFTFLMLVNLAAQGANKLRAFSLIGILMGIQLVFGLLFGGGYLWVADLTGFGAGFVLSFIVSPGGFGRVLNKIRQR